METDSLGKSCKAGVTGNNHSFVLKHSILPIFSNKNNRHYESAEGLGLNMADKKVFKKFKQRLGDKRGRAGVFSLRGFARAYYRAGTNRAPVSYSLEHFLCTPMASVHDTNLSDEFVGMDIPRSPGGVPETYKTTCVGCHSHMDALRGAFAYYDFKDSSALSTVVLEKLFYTYSGVVEKMNQNMAYEQGWRVVNDFWRSNWALNSSNRDRGLTMIGSGQGAKDFGKHLVSQPLFAKCMAKQVVEKVCAKKAKINSSYIEELGRYFISSNYNMKKLFAKVGVQCSK